MKILAKIVFLPLGSAAAASATGAALRKKMFGSGHPLDLASGTMTLNISNKEMIVTMKINKYLE